MGIERVATGSIHGRFQPFHNGHLEYLVAALERSDFLYIGITQFRRRSLIQVASGNAVHRAQPQSNPLSYFERVQTIRTLLGSLNVHPRRYLITPLPIEEPAELTDFLPTSVTMFTTTYDAWNRSKIETFTELGYPVVNLWTREDKAVAGEQVRESLRNGDERWRSLVPVAVANVLDELEIGARLRSMALPGQ